MLGSHAIIIYISAMVLIMRDFKFDMDIILRNSERFDVQVSEQPGSITIKGNPVDVVEEINNELGISSSDCQAYAPRS